MSFKKVLFIFSLSLLVLSCSSKNKLLGTWKLSNVDIEKAIKVFPEDQQEFARGMMNQAFKNVKGKMKITFEEGGVYQMQTPLLDGEIKVEKGKWSLSKDSKKLFLTNPDSGKEMHRVLKFTDKNLNLEMAQSGFGSMEMDFVKE
jgi:hypothetical protein